MRVRIYDPMLDRLIYGRACLGLNFYRAEVDHGDGLGFQFLPGTLRTYAEFVHRLVSMLNDSRELFSHRLSGQYRPFRIDYAGLTVRKRPTYMPVADTLLMLCEDDSYELPVGPMVKQTDDKFEIIFGSTLIYELQQKPEPQECFDIFNYWVHTRQCPACHGFKIKPSGDLCEHCVRSDDSADTDFGIFSPQWTGSRLVAALR